MNTYREYLTYEKAITIEQMEAIHNEIVEEIGADPDSQEIYEELLNACFNYAVIRADWSLMDNDVKMEKDPLRTSRHNMVILQLNLLARYLKKIGKAAAWRDKLGYEEDDRFNRKVMGDFACYLAFINGICER